MIIDGYSLTPADIAFLKRLPENGSYLEVTGPDLTIAHAMHLWGLCFLSSGTWPNMIVRRTFDTQKILSKCP